MTYDDIIHLPHHEPTTHPRMSRRARAAQFAPFAALTGHAEALRQVERQVLSEQEPAHETHEPEAP